MIIVIKKLKTPEGTLYSVLETSPTQIHYSVKTHEELISIYESENKLITGFNYRVKAGEIIFRTSIGTSNSSTNLIKSSKFISLDITLEKDNIWAILSNILTSDYGCELILNDTEYPIDSISTRQENGIIINGTNLSKDEILQLSVKNEKSIEELSQEYKDNTNFFSVRVNKIRLRLSELKYDAEFTSGKTKVLFSNLKPVISQLIFEYNKIMIGFLSAYNAFSVQPDVHGDEKLIEFLKDTTMGNCLQALENSHFEEQEKELYSRGIQDYIEYGNHSSFTYSMADYFIYRYKRSEIVLLQLLLCNCG